MIEGRAAARGSGRALVERRRVVVTGASGYLGHRLVPLAAERAAVVALVGSGEWSGRRPPGMVVRRVDLREPAAVAAALGALRPDAVIHAAAVNPPGPPRAAPGGGADAMAAVNVGGTAAIVDSVARLGSGCRLVHVSSDVVHDGTAAPYADDAPPTPQSDYAASKAAAEAVVLEQVPWGVVVRTSLIYGLGRMDRGTSGFADRLRRGETLRLFRDVLRQPVWVDALAASLVRLALDLPGESGLLNVAGAQALSRAAFARRMLAWWGVPLPPGLVEEVSAAGLPDVPPDLRLRLDRARRLGLPTLGVDEVLAAHRRPG